MESIMKSLVKIFKNTARYNRSLPARIRVKYLTDNLKGIVSSTKRNSKQFSFQGRPLPEVLRAWGIDDIIKIS
jgi:hypothetical protein